MAGIFVRKMGGRFANRQSAGCIRAGPGATAGLEIPLFRSDHHAIAPGYLRKNGVPYSDKAVLKEYYDLFSEPNADTWFMVMTVVEDPTYLALPFVTTSHFKKIADASGWDPEPCTAR